jgi:hypothetical protein
MQRIASALPHIPEAGIAELITGASGHFYKSLSESDRAVVITQIMGAISEAFYYLVAITAIGFITSLFLSVSIPQQRYPDAWSGADSLFLQPRKLFLSGGAAAA